MRIWPVKMRRILLAGVAALSLGGHGAVACTGGVGTRVDAIYPSGNAVPENMLRFYLYFTGPMAEEDILPRVALRKGDGSEVEGAFLSNRFELWSPDRTRLTLLFDPGRVKTGLDAHDALGRALVSGESYQLTVDPGARDAAGCPLAEGFSHRFVASESDVAPPDPETWTIEAPKPETTEPLRVSLGSPHDHLSMAYKIRVLRHGEVVPGRLDLQAAETVWVFTPKEPWAASGYSIEVGEELEDLAGNRPGQLFDQPIGALKTVPKLAIHFSPSGD